MWADETPFDYRMLDEGHPENFAELKRRWPIAKFPLLVDGDESVIETTPIIEHLHARHRGKNDWIPQGDEGRRARFLDRFFDIYVMTNMQKAGNDVLRPEGSRDPYGVEQARAELRMAYDWLEANLSDGPWAVGEHFQSLTALPRHRCSMPTGWKRSDSSGQGWQPTAHGCSRTRS